MKKIITIIVLAFIFISFGSCRDESLNPLLPYKTKLGLVRSEKIKPSSAFIDMNNTEEVIDLYIESPENNVDSYTLKAKIRIGADWSEYKELATITEFPSHVMLTAEEIATAMGMELSDIPNYSKFYFLGTSVSEGITVDLSYVIGAGFSPDDNPDGVASGLISAYVEQKHLLKF